MKFFGRRLSTAAAPASAMSWQPPRRTLPGAGTIVGVALAAVAAVFMGMVTALGSMQLTVIVAGAMLALPMLLLISTRQMMPVLFVVVFLLQGTAQFFFGLRAATWVASGLIAMLLLRGLLEMFEFKRRDGLERPAGGTASIVLFAGLYLLVYLFSLALGQASTGQRISTLRFSLPIFGVLLAFYSHRWEDVQIRRLWWIIVAVAVLQLPLSMYQHFFMIATLGWDGVVGSFGKGQSSALVLFVLAAMLYVLSRWSNGLMAGWKVGLLFVIGLAIILLGEVKAVLVWLPLGVGFVLRRRLMRNFAQLIIFVCLSMAFLAGTYFAYKALYWHHHPTDDTLVEKVESIGGYVFDTSNINYRTKEISRGASLALWYKDPLPTTIERLIGYGPSSTTISASTGMGKIAARYRGLTVGSTAISTLLWDVGILGTGAYVLFLLASVQAGWRYVRTAENPERRAVVDVCTAILLLLLTTLIYNRSLIDEPTVQMLCFFCIGCIVQFSRFAPQAQAARAPAAQRRFPHAVVRTSS